MAFTKSVLRELSSLPFGQKRSGRPDYAPPEDANRTVRATSPVYRPSNRDHLRRRIFALCQGMPVKQLGHRVTEARSFSSLPAAPLNFCNNTIAFLCDYVALWPAFQSASYSGYSRSMIWPGRAGSVSISKASRKTFFCRSRWPGLPIEFPTLKPFGYMARGGRICREASGPTVIRAVGMPRISISR